MAMKTNKVLTIIVSLGASLLLGLSVFGQEPVHEAQGMRVPVGKEAADKKSPAPLSLGVTDAFQAGRNIYDLGDATAELEAVNKKADGRGNGQGPLRVGVVRTVEKTFDPDSFIKTEAPIETPSEAPKQLWTMALRSPEAFALRLHFVNFDAGSGSVLVYARNGHELITLGPFTGKGPQQNGDFWTALLPGDTASIEVSGVSAPRLEISEVMHFDRDIDGGLPHTNGQQKAMATAEQGCHLDVMCENVNSFARDATVLLNYRVGNEPKVCSGTLLMDLDDETVVPYLLTANHCNITNANVNSLMATALFQSDSCGGPRPDNSSLPQLTGGVVLETHGDNDMKFIRLNGAVPAGATLAGWSTGKPPDGSVGIHHPDGAFKRATFFDPSSYVFCQYTYDPDYWVMEARRGGIEKGSSGSGLFNSIGQLFGQLRGRCGPGTDEEKGNCSTDDGWRAVYGKFSVTYPIIRRWLEIGGTINVNRYHGGNELGTPSEPYRTVNAGYNLAWDNTRLKIKAGHYNERVTFSKPMTILADGGTVTIGQ
jgi:hypothetical protein